MKATELIESLQFLIAAGGDHNVLIDTGSYLCTIDQIDLGGSDEGIIIWTGDIAEEPC